MSLMMMEDGTPYLAGEAPFSDAAPASAVCQRVQHGHRQSASGSSVRTLLPR